MPAKSPVVHLTVHKNTIERRRKRLLAREMAAAAGDMARERDIRAWAIVGLGADGRAYAAWDTGAVMPKWAFAATMADILRCDVNESETEEDWKPPLRKPE